MHAIANFPSDLRIFPSSMAHLSLPSRAGETSNYPIEDIEGFGIAGRSVPFLPLLSQILIKRPRTWEATYLLIPYLLPPTPSSEFEYSPHPPHLLSPSHPTILEIGSGTGFLSLSLSLQLREGTTLVMTDLSEVCPLLHRNLSSSPSSPPQILIRPLSWGSSSDMLKLEKDGIKATMIIASDLVYFPFLYPSLLRTLIWLTEGEERVGVVFGYKIRSLVREEPFWRALGYWFEMETVLRRNVPSIEDPDPTWDKYGGEGLHVFLCHRRAESIGRVVDKDDERLMEEGLDDQFELQLLSSISLSSDSD